MPWSALPCRLVKLWRHSATARDQAPELILGCATQVTVTVGVYIFDLLYANGEVLVQLPLCERQERLKQVGVPRIQATRGIVGAC